MYFSQPLHPTVSKVHPTVSTLHVYFSPNLHPNLSKLILIAWGSSLNMSKLSSITRIHYSYSLRSRYPVYVLLYFDPFVYKFNNLFCVISCLRPFYPIPGLPTIAFRSLQEGHLRNNHHACFQGFKHAFLKHLTSKNSEL
ncbi:hypothetical protein HanIR_Chr04g0166861 [Helianthus annuus]|nr:hypothetical protein HanIR_Chr04g0166861 [Helianthus annuus]